MFPIGSVCGTWSSRTALAAAGLVLGLAAFVIPAGAGTTAPAAKPTNGAEPDIDDRGVESDPGRRRAAGEHVDPARHRFGAGRRGGDRPARDVGGPAANLVLL